MNSKHLHELIDSCRPGHADIDQPELGELARELSRDPSLQRLFERSQELDEEIRTAFQSVTPPAGLAQRLIEAIETPAIETSAIECGEGTPGVAETAPRVELARSSSRRTFGIWAGVASLAAVTAVITLWFQRPQPISLSSSGGEIAEIVDRWNAELDDTNWQTTANMPSQDFPTWQHLQISSGDRWQWVLNRRIACYDLAINEGTVRLYVIKPTTSLALPTAPPIGYPSPNGWHVGAWQANGRVYYLAAYSAADSKRLYSSVIDRPFNPA